MLLFSLFFALYYEHVSFFQPPSKRFKLSYTVPACESSVSFDPLSIKQHSISWVHHDGKPLQPGLQSPRPYNSHLASVWVDSVSCGDVSADVSMLAFPDPVSFLVASPSPALENYSCFNLVSSIPGCSGLAGVYGAGTALL